MANRKKSSNSEFEVYKPLMDFCEGELISTTFVNAPASSKGVKFENHWRHPDVIGFQDYSMNEEKSNNKLSMYDENTINIMKKIDKAVYSFEVKEGKLTISNIRESVFEAIANSSWANFSYLVAEGLSPNAKNELEILCRAHNIGFILLNRNEPKNSKILIEAKRTELNWDIFNKLISINDQLAESIEKILNMA